jgi:hypothetical protein
VEVNFLPFVSRRWETPCSPLSRTVHPSERASREVIGGGLLGSAQVNVIVGRSEFPFIIPRQHNSILHLYFADERLSAHHCQQQHQQEEEEEEAPLSEMKEVALLEVTPPLSEMKERTNECIFLFGMKKVKSFGSAQKERLYKKSFHFVPKHRRIVHKVRFIRPPTLEPASHKRALTVTPHTQPRLTTVLGVRHIIQYPITK